MRRATRCAQTGAATWKRAATNRAHGDSRPTTNLTTARTGAGAAWRALEAPRSAGRTAARAARFVPLMSAPLSERSERSERSELATRPAVRASQGSRRAAPTASSARHAAPAPGRASGAGRMTEKDCRDCSAPPACSARSHRSPARRPELPVPVGRSTHAFSPPGRIAKMAFGVSPALPAATAIRSLTGRRRHERPRTAWRDDDVQEEAGCNPFLIRPPGLVPR